MKKAIKTIPAGKFKANCLRIMDEVNTQHRSVIITKHGKPVAKLVPMDEQPKNLFGAMRGSVKILGDIVEPTGEIWEVEQDD